ncbi:phosphoribosylanthranilate isomerase [Peribacillus sp. SCS-37]|uniref:phosphoribosylanthranilate isomerase n=1 Tax=Paraperibacillus esterisolvens TaxID=3115296 RepID=UPI00390693AA
MKVKICGITDKMTAAAAVNYGAAALGFVFAESKRKIDRKLAREIIHSLPPGIESVGVFVNESPEIIEETALFTGLTMIQLHGDEDEETVDAINLPVIKAFPYSAESLQKWKGHNARYLLLDAPAGRYRGGNGTSFNWREAEGLGRKVHNLILAGGLNPENVQEAISIVSPAMVDVSSGVETNGKKDLQKIKKFIENAKNGGMTNVG